MDNSISESNCVICGKLFVRRNYSKRKTCSHECQLRSMSISSTGENNPRYGVPWTEEQVEAQKNRMALWYQDPEHRYVAGKSNRGVKFTPERIAKMIENRTFESYSHPHTAENKILIGKLSKAKFTPEFKLRYKQTMIDRGWWIDPNNKSDYEIYFKEAEWVEKMFDRAQGEELAMLQKCGVFSNKTNHSGVVRDHRLSRKIGFEEGVFPAILRHPENCQIILHRKNVAKRFTNIDALTKDQLFDLIKNYVGAWKEQQLCLELITKYENGERWKREVMPNV